MREDKRTRENRRRPKIEREVQEDSETTIRKGHDERQLSLKGVKSFLHSFLSINILKIMMEVE